MFLFAILFVLIGAGIGGAIYPLVTPKPLPQAPVSE
jgi:hypothetical protein